MEDENHVGANDDEKAVTTHAFDFPTEMCGRLIGQRGRNVSVIKEKSGAEIFIRAKRYDASWQIVTLEGASSQRSQMTALFRGGSISWVMNSGGCESEKVCQIY